VPHRRRRHEKTKTNESEPEDVDCAAAEPPLAAAQQMPGGPERIAALKKAGLLRFKADERRGTLRDQERASKLDFGRAHQGPTSPGADLKPCSSSVIAKRLL
jgi:hypothetical protein